MKRNATDATASLNKFLDRDQREIKKIFIVGDFLIDERHDIEINRLSPEAPIPIMYSEASHDRTLVRMPGGAGNVCMQLRHFNTQAKLFSIMDDHGYNVAALSGLPIRQHQSTDWRWITPVKHRFYHGNDMVARWDVERPAKKVRADAVCKQIRTTLTNHFVRDLHDETPDCVLFSDYDKGLFDHATANAMIEACIACGVPTVVDPKRDASLWRGCTIIKPNAAEAAAMCRHHEGDPLLHLMNHTFANAVIMTNGGDGITSYVRDDGYYEFKPDKSDDVVNVVGAGDAFAAVLALATAHGLQPHEAAEAAFLAGSRYVHHSGNRPICPAELRTLASPIQGKICKQGEVARLLKSMRHGGKTVVFTNGCFDLLHEGHMSTLNFAKSQADILVVGVNSDESVARLKGPTRPIRNISQRTTALAWLQCVDLVVVFDDDWPEALVKEISPSVLVKGQDYKGQKIAGQEHCKKVVLAPTLPNISTTAIIDATQRICK